MLSQKRFFIASLIILSGILLLISRPHSVVPTAEAASTTTRFTVSVFLHGIGKSGDNSNTNGTGNMSPLTISRTISIEVSDSKNTVVKTITGTVTYNPAGGNFTGTIDAGTLVTGIYTLRIKSDKFLRRQVPGIITVTSGQLTTLPSIVLITGDITNDNKLDISDFNLLLDCFSDLLPARNCNAAKKTTTDISDDGSVNQTDYNLLLREIAVQGDTTTAPTDSQQTNTLPTIQPGIQSVTPVSKSGPTLGIWISKDEIMKLPMSGNAWNSVKSAADSNWGSACLYDNNCMHDVNTLAGALVATRTDDAAMRAKVIKGFESAMSSTLSRALELSRGLQTYIIAADIIGYHDAAFEAWVRKMLTTNIQGHSGGVGVLGTAINSSNNWGGHARASVAAAAVYLNDATLKQQVVTAYKAFIGVAPSSSMVFTNTSWHADSKNPAGENRKGATIQGKNVSGALPEDWRRSAEYQWPPAVTNYMWEGMQGFVVTAVILDRAGLVPLSTGDDALVRAMNALYGTGEAASNSPKFNNPPSGDDTWIPWVVNYYAGTTFPTSAAAAGKNMAWTDWTFGK